ARDLRPGAARAGLRPGARARRGAHLAGLPADRRGRAVRGGGGGPAGDAGRHGLQGQEQGPRDAPGNPPPAARGGAGMTGCPARAELWELLAERPPPTQERSVLAHVETCSACQQALEELTTVCVTGSWVAAPSVGADVPGAPCPEKHSFLRG